MGQASTNGTLSMSTFRSRRRTPTAGRSTVAKLVISEGGPWRIALGQPPSSESMVEPAPSKMNE